MSYGLGWAGRDLNKKNVSSCEQPAKAGRVVNTCYMTGGSHTV